uniref:Uncharacterized protein n=1 Tax=Cucumis melo TaxID=3656 RepID=A0A9I9ELI6_CUCME
MYLCFPVVIALFFNGLWTLVITGILLSLALGLGNRAKYEVTPKDTLFIWLVGGNLVLLSECLFNLRSVLLWTINDFPAYGNLSGCCVKGYKACPICGDKYKFYKTSVLREDIIDLCNMNEVKTFTLVAYMMYLYSSVIGSKENVQYVFVDPSLISSGNT